jgi:hypothetical protein
VFVDLQPHPYTNIGCGKFLYSRICFAFAYLTSGADFEISGNVCVSDLNVFAVNID